jgi:hypothetical protein
MLTGDPLRLFRETLLAGSYNLLLGAGVSLDSTNSKGVKLRSAGQLTGDLCTLKNVRASTPLHRVYPLLSPDEIKIHLIDPYSGCAPGPSLAPLPNYVWRRIFTFNVDDVIESLYERAGPKKQNLTSINFNAAFEPTPSRDELQIIHLHGTVRESATGFVFSYTEYARVMTGNNPWTHMLAEILATESFIIAGASLDEVDLEYYLSRRSDSTPRRGRGPSLLIEPYPDAVTHAVCERHGLTLVTATFGDFLNWMRGAFPSPPTIAELYVPAAPDLFAVAPTPTDQLRFFTDFRIVNAGDKPRATTPTPFLYGKPPDQSDLDSHLDIPRHDAGRLLQEVEDAFKNITTEPKLILVSDPAGTGKSTILQRVGHDWIRRGNHVLAVQAVARLDVDTAIRCLATVRRPILLLADGIADYAEQILPLLQDVSLKGKLVVLASERSYRQGYVELIFGGVSTIIGGISDLNRTERRQLVALYTGFGLVGTPEAIHHPERYSELLRGDPIAVAACRILNDFRPLHDIVESLWAAADAAHRLPYLSVALAVHCVSTGIRYSIVQAIAGMGTPLAAMMDGNKVPLAIDYSDIGRNYLIPLNGVLGDQILHRAVRHDSAMLRQAFSRVAACLAPHVNRRAIMLRTPEARLASRLFNVDTITKPLLGNHAEDFYIEAREQWRWNSRYWEQRALLTAETDLLTAVQHARHAVSIETHPFTLTTLGKLLLQQMDLGGPDRESLFSEAFDGLASAIKREGARSRIRIHPYMTLFAGASRFLENGSDLTQSQNAELVEFMKEAKYAFHYDRPLLALAQRLEALL